MSLKYYKVEVWILKEAIDNLDKAAKALDDKGKTSILIERCKNISKIIKDNYPAVNDFEDGKTKPKS
jgi:hypothetical protein